MIASVEGRERARRGFAKVIQLQLASPPCVCGNPKSRRNEKCGDCRARERGKGKGPRIERVPSIVDAFPGKGRCLDRNVAKRIGRGKSSERSCGVQWGNLDHRHCACGDPIAAYWRPGLDVVRETEDDGTVASEYMVGRCGKCELRNLPLSLRVWTERVQTKDHQENPSIRGKVRAAPPIRATDCSSTVATGGLY